MRLYFIRHGQSENNRLWDLTGSDENRSEDPGLTEAGWEQARLATEYLRNEAEPWDGQDGETGFGITHLYCSPMFRALATGMEIASGLGLSLRIWTDWHECGGMFLQDKRNGVFHIKPGMTRAQILERFPGVVIDERIQPEGWWNRSYESEEERVVRARRVVKELMVRHGVNSEDRVAVVGHGAFYVHFVAALMQRDDTFPVWLRMNNTGLSRFDFHGRENALVFHNAVIHLPARLIT